MAKVWEHVFSALYDPLLWVGERAGMASRRKELLGEAGGRVLELGAGTGLNLPHYPDEIEELTLTEPSAPMLPRLERRLRKTDLDGQVVAATAEELPFEDDSFDTVVSTLVLCTVDDPRRAIDETARVLRPGGKLLFLDFFLDCLQHLGRTRRLSTGRHSYQNLRPIGIERGIARRR